MNFKELQAKLITLTKSNITQTALASALDITSSTVSTRIKTNSQLSVEEIEKLEKYFDVELLNGFSNGSLIDKIKEKYNLSDSDLEFIISLLSSKTERKMAKIFFRALDGDKDAKDIVKMIISSPALAEQFSTKNPESILNMGKKKEDEEYLKTLAEIKKSK